MVVLFLCSSVLCFLMSACLGLLAIWSSLYPPTLLSVLFCKLDRKYVKTDLVVVFSWGRWMKTCLGKSYSLGLSSFISWMFVNSCIHFFRIWVLGSHVVSDYIAVISKIICKHISLKHIKYRRNFQMYCRRIFSNLLCKIQHYSKANGSSKLRKSTHYAKRFRTKSNSISLNLLTARTWN